MARYQLILHGAIEPTDLARAQLKDSIHRGYKFTAGSTEDIFKLLPQVLAGNLSLLTAEGLKEELEALGADIELMMQDELDPQPGRPSFVREGSPDIPSTVGFELDTDFKPSPESVSEPKTAEPVQVETFSFEFVDDPKAEEQTNSQPSTTGNPTSSGLSLASYDERTASVHESDQGPAPEQENVDSNSVPEDFDPGSAYRRPVEEGSLTEGVEENGDQVPEWQRVQVDWKPGSGTIDATDLRQWKHSNTVTIATALFLLGGIIYLLLTPVPQQSISIQFGSIDSLLPKKVAKKRGPAKPLVGKPFTSYWLGTSGEGPVRVTVRLGASEVGYDIQNLSLISEPPQKLTRQEYMQGKRPQPWLRKFEASQVLPKQPGPGETPDLGTVIVRQIVGRAIIELDGQSTPLKAYAKINASLVSDTNTFHGDWVVSNIDGDPAAGETNFVRKASGDRYVFHLSGNFSAPVEVIQIVQPTPSEEEEQFEVIEERPAEEAPPVD